MTKTAQRMLPASSRSFARARRALEAVRRGWGRAFLACVLAWSAVVTPAGAVEISNTAGGETGGVLLDASRARVRLERLGGVAGSALAEIAPNRVLASRRSQEFVYDLLLTIGAPDAGVTRIEITAPAGYGSLNATRVRVAGAVLSPDCPAPGSGRYCASVVGPVLTLVLGDPISASGTHVRIEFTADTPPAAGTGDFAAVVSEGAVSVTADPGNADGDPDDANDTEVAVYESQGEVLRLDKSANKRDAFIGEVVTYVVSIRNTLATDVVDVRIEDAIPPNFKYLRGSARLDGAPLADPTGLRPLIFEIGTVPGLVDANGNGQADPGEAGYRSLVYQLVIGSGARPGSFTNTAVAKDYCARCEVSNRASAKVDVRIDREFELGTIIGKVFEDPDRDGWQDPGEKGVAKVMVALDDGTYALTDEHGRYHFPAVRPGQRLVKINKHTLSPGAEIVMGETRVLSLTPGLMARANFGVVLRSDRETIGAAGAEGVAVEATGRTLPLDLRGSAEAPSLLINGAPIALPSSDVRLGRGTLEETIRLKGASLETPVRFEIETELGAAIASWRLHVYDRLGQPLRALEGSGAPPPSVEWDGRVSGGELVAAGEIYQYQIEVDFADGARAASPRRLVGVNRQSVIALELRGEAFESGKDRLSPEARRSIREAAEILRRYPDEKVVIEGHTDDVGSEASNLDLSRRRAQAAAECFVSEQELPAERFVLRWYGEERPIAPNTLEEGRARNRRVEIRGELAELEEAEILEGYRAAPRVRVNGESVPAGELGRFAVRVEPAHGAGVEIEVEGTSGRSARTTVQVPRLEVLAPLGQATIPAGGSALGCSSAPAGAPAALSCRLQGRTDPGASVELDGLPVTVGADGSFTAEVALAPGPNVFGLLARDARGLTRLANLEVVVSERDGSGRRVIAGQTVPRLTVTLPPRDARLTSTRLAIAGETAPGHRVEINGRPAKVGPDGAFAETVELPRGRSRLVVTVTDPEGHTGSIEREIEVSKHELFLLAFADGRVSQLSASGNLGNADLDSDSELFVDGRLAFYLKGTISGKVLITSAFDSGSAEPAPLFGDLDREESRRLLTYIDPDRFYPIYGDASTVVYDAESRGKFYLALESRTVAAVVGNYPLALSDSELAGYRRTLYGGRFAYRSASKTSFGDPETELILFGADVRQAHVRDEIRATGGSLYYLSRRDVIEGSERVTLVVRDKNTGLVLSRTPQQRDVDYTMKYEEGRLMFHRPLSSVVPGGTIVDSNPLTGHAVVLEVDYETRLEDFEKTAAGARVRRQIGDRVAVGGTYVQDELEAGSYELGAVDAEVRLGQHSRIAAEVAQSEGSDSIVSTSRDGGLTYTPVPGGASREGTAWKVGADLDVGEWFSKPQRYRVKFYAKELEAGFFSAGNSAEQGTRKIGVLGSFAFTANDILDLRHEREERSGTASLLPGAPQETSLASAQWRHTRKRWGFAAELFASESQDAAGVTLQESRFGAARFWAALSQKLRAELEHQQTLEGPDNDRTGIALRFQALPSLALEVRGSDGDRGSAAQAGAILDLGGSTIYLTQRLSEDPTGTQTATILGTRAPLGPGSQVYSEYQLEDTPRGDRSVALLGLQRQWDLAPGFRFRLAGEVAEVESEASKTRRSALSTSLSYATEERFSATTRNEIRREDGDADRTQLFSHSQLDIRLSPDFTLLARYRFSKTEDGRLNRTEAELEERSVGLAYRPTASDRFNALARYTRLSDLRPFAAAAELRTEREMDVLSVETLLQITPRLEWAAKAAARMQEERVDGLAPVESKTFLTIQRLNYRIWKPIELGLEYRVLEQRLADDRREGWLGEISWRFLPRLRFGLGYNFTDFSDNEFSQNDFSVEGWFLRVQGTY